MNKEEKALAKAKKIQCILGTFFLIPPILGVIAFVLCLFDISLFDNHEKFAKMSGLSSSWTCDFDGDGGGGMSAAPIYLGMMAIVGAYLIKDSIKYFFIKE